jgi:hypothetical protein
MRSLVLALVSATFVFAASLAQAQQGQPPVGTLAVPEVSTPPAPSPGTNCLTLTNVGDVLTCIAQAHIVVVPLHFYTGEYTAFSEADFGPRYDPRNYAGYGPIAADMCKKNAPQISNPTINFTEFKSISGGCCGYAFFVMACVGIK